MNYSYDKVLEFFSEHETAIYGLGPTDNGADDEEGSFLWCIKKLDEMADITIAIDKRDETMKETILKVICSLIDIYEDQNDTSEWRTGEDRGSPCEVCIKCGGRAVYRDRFCPNCGRPMTNGY